MLDKKRHTSTYTSGYKNRIASIILLLIGILTLIVFTLIFIAGNGLLPVVDALPYLFIGIIGISISTIILLTGIIMFFVGRSKAKKQKNQNIP